MRLINRYTLQLQEFQEPPKQYAILSHRWGSDEITYKDFVKGRNTESAGHQKVLKFCDFVRRWQRSIEWVWVDTCCIDKRSSAELSEAVNSMWEWYENATFCLAYLADVPGVEVGDGPMLDDVKCSIWFARGWTLQELLAPENVIFCNGEWQSIGSKHLAPLLRTITEVTGIRDRCLIKSAELREASVAEKLSWASKRQTTREEDVAYCLLGLLDINLPLLYGEGGQKAFRRLQQEFIQQSDDESIFAFGCRKSEPERWRPVGVLARSPADFRFGGIVKRTDLTRRQPYSITHKSLRFETRALQISETKDIANWASLYLVPLNCYSVYEPLPSGLYSPNWGQFFIFVIEYSTGRTYRTAPYKPPENLWSLWKKKEDQISKVFFLGLSTMYDE